MAKKIVPAKAKSSQARDMNKRADQKGSDREDIVKAGLKGFREKLLGK